MSGDNEDITKRVRAVYREWKTQHIDDQLDDVFRFAHGGGLGGVVEPGTRMVWTIDPGRAGVPRLRGQLAGRCGRRGRGVPDRATSRRRPIPGAAA